MRVLSYVLDGAAAGIHGSRDEYTDLGTALLAVARRDVAAVLFDELLHDRETETRSLRLARDVRVERLVHDVAREARPVVDDLDLDQIGIHAMHSPGRDPYQRLGLVLGRLDRVAQQIVQHLAKTSRVGFDTRKALVERELDR
jgi:hypothetical protein